MMERHDSSEGRPMRSSSFLLLRSLLAVSMVCGTASREVLSAGRDCWRLRRPSVPAGSSRGGEQRVPERHSETSLLDAPLFRGLPHLRAVTPVRDSPVAQRRILHVCQAHMVSYKDFVVLEKQREGELPSDELLRRYETYLAFVEEIVRENTELLRELLPRLKTKRLYLEVAPEDLFLIQLRVRLERKGKGSRENRLWMGEAGQLLLEGGVEELVPVDDAGLQRKVLENERRGLREEALAAHEEREGNMAKVLEEDEGDLVLLLGGWHNLRGNLAEETSSYLRLATHAYLEHGPEGVSGR